MLVLVAGTLLGVILTLIAGQEPGGLLGFFIIVGTIAAALGIRRGKVYLLFPAPALAFFVAAIVTGKVHDAKLGSSTAGLGAGFTQWVAGIFFPAVVATIVVLLVGGGRWLLGRQLITGQSPLPAGRPAPGKARPAPRDRRPGVDSWADDDPFDGPAPRSAKTGPSPATAEPVPPGRAPPMAPAAPGPPAARPAHGPRPLGRPPPSRRPQPADGPPASRPQPARRGPRPPATAASRPRGPRPRANGRARPAPTAARPPRPSPDTGPRQTARAPRAAPADTRTSARRATGLETLTAGSGGARCHPRASGLAYEPRLRAGHPKPRAPQVSELFQRRVTQHQVLNPVRTSEVNLRFRAVPVPVG